MRIAHVTDIHWMVRPNLLRVWYGKRALGTANLFLLGRRWEFHHEVQKAVIRYVRHLDPDLVIITGDLTAQALPAEFALAREDLGPLLDHHTTFIVPGNHDVYTRGAQRARRMHRYFGDWMWLDRPPLARLDLREVTVLGLDPNRPTSFNAAGRVPDDQMQALEDTLNEPGMRDRFVVLALHYPLLGKQGRPYDNAGHGLLNARDLIELFDRTEAVPRLVLHGHRHHGYKGQITTRNGRVIELHNPGSSGLAYDPDRRKAAAINEYVIDQGRLVRMERHLSDGETFAIEPGGAYATGW